MAPPMRRPPRAIERIMSGSNPSSATICASVREASPNNSHDRISRSSDMLGHPSCKPRTGDKRWMSDADDVDRAYRDAVDTVGLAGLAQRVSDGGDDRRGGGDARRLADTLRAQGCEGLGLLDQRHHDWRH